MLEWFRFSNAIKWISGNILDQIVDPLEFFLIGFLPVKVVFPGFIDENRFHSSINSLVKEFPDFNFSIAESSLLWFSLEESSYWVA